MSISSVSAYSNYSAISSGSKITSAAADPAGSAITEKLENETTGIKQEINSKKSSQNLYNTADAAYQSIKDNLQRMRELSLKASNGILADSDKSAIQSEVSQIKDSITQTIQNTEYNGKKILNGEGSEFGIEEMSLDKLGLKDFDVTGSFSIDSIDNAMNMISEERTNIGASYNGLSYSINNLENYNSNLTSTLSNKKDSNVAEEISKMKIKTALEQYELNLQKKQREEEESKLNILK